MSPYEQIKKIYEKKISNKSFFCMCDLDKINFKKLLSGD